MQDNLNRILVFDPEEVFPAIIYNALRYHGFVCDLALDADDLLENLRLHKYELLIVNLNALSNFQESFPGESSGLMAVPRVILMIGKEVRHAPINLAHLRVASCVTGSMSPEQLIVHVESVIAEGLAGYIDDLLQARNPSAEELSISSLVSLVLRNIGNSILDLKHLSDALAGSNNIGQQGVCHVFNCPRLAQLTTALRDTVDVLESTKNSFKSKELGNLRKNLDELLREVAEDDPARQQT